MSWLQSTQIGSERLTSVSFSISTRNIFTFINAITWIVAQAGISRGWTLRTILEHFLAWRTSTYPIYFRFENTWRTTGFGPRLWVWSSRNVQDLGQYFPVSKIQMFRSTFKHISKLSSQLETMSPYLRQIKADLFITVIVLLTSMSFGNCNWMDGGKIDPSLSGTY